MFAADSDEGNISFTSIQSKHEMASVFLRLVIQGWFRCGGAEGRVAWPAAPKREADSEEKAGGGKKANRHHPRPPGVCVWSKGQ